MPCPTQLVLPDANSITAFKPGAGQDLIDIDHKIMLNEVLTSCTTFRNQKTGVGNMDVNVSLAMLAERGPTNTTKRAAIPYFIAVTNNERKVLYREEFTLNVNFEGNRSKLSALTPSVTLSLPLRKEIVGLSYRIYGGLKTSKKQLLYNRKKNK